MPDPPEVGDVQPGQAPDLPATPPGPYIREKMALWIAMSIIGIFGVLMFIAVFAALFWNWPSDSDLFCTSSKGINPAIEVMNLIGHIFGPLLGVIVGFYFGTEYLKSSRSDR